MRDPAARVYLHGYHVHPIAFRGQPAIRQVELNRGCQASKADWCDGVNGRAKATRAAAFHLHEHEFVAIVRDQVDLPLTEAYVAVHHPVTLTRQ